MAGVVPGFVIRLGDGGDSFGAISGTVVVTVRGRSWRGGSSSERRRSWSSRRPSEVMVRPRQPAEARSSTAQTRVRQLVSPGSRPMTLTRRRAGAVWWRGDGEVGVLGCDGVGAG